MMTMVQGFELVLFYVPGRIHRKPQKFENRKKSGERSTGATEGEEEAIDSGGGGAIGTTAFGMFGIRCKEH